MPPTDTVMQEVCDEHADPAPDEIDDYGRWLGITADEQEEFRWIAREGLTAPMPSSWMPCKSSLDSSIYYFNFSTGESTWDHPGDIKSRKLLDAERCKRSKASLSPATPSTSRTRPRRFQRPLLVADDRSDQSLVVELPRPPPPPLWNDPPSPSRSQETPLRAPKSSPAIHPDGFSVGHGMQGHVQSDVEQRLRRAAIERSIWHDEIEIAEAAESTLYHRVIEAESSAQDWRERALAAEAALGRAGTALLQSEVAWLREKDGLLAEITSLLKMLDGESNS